MQKKAGEKNAKINRYLSFGKKDGLRSQDKIKSPYLRYHPNQLTLGTVDIVIIFLFPF